MFCFTSKVHSKRDDVLNKVKFNAQYFRYFKEFQQDFEIAKHAVSQDGNLLRYASEELCDNIEIVKVAYGNNNHSIRFASERIQKSPSLLNK